MKAEGEIPFLGTVDDIDIASLPYVPVEDYLGISVCGGVYFAFAGDRICYIGEARDINARWRSHGLRYRLMLETDARIAWLAINDKLKRKRLEREAIARFAPLWNKGGSEYMDSFRLDGIRQRALAQKRAIKRAANLAKRQAATGRGDVQLPGCEGFSGSET